MIILITFILPIYLIVGLFVLGYSLDERNRGVMAIFDMILWPLDFLMTLLAEIAERF